MRNVESSTINLDWGQVNCSHRNGIILGYTVQYEVIGSGNIQYLNVSKIFTVGSINELMPFMTYSISVAAVNSAGTGVFSIPIINQTRPSKYYSAKLKIDFSFNCCFTDVYLSLNNVIIPNHGYVTINDIGSNDMSALICNANSTASGRKLGDWFSPSGDKVGGMGNGQNSENYVPGFFKTKKTKMLLLKATTGSPPEGIYHCEVNNTRETFQKLYVGLYNKTSGHGMK